MNHSYKITDTKQRQNSSRRSSCLLENLLASQCSSCTITCTTSFSSVELVFCCSALQWVLEPEPVGQLPFAPLPLVEDLLLCSEYNAATDKRAWLEMMLYVSQRTAHHIATSTVGQRSNPMWALIRKNRLTASNFGSVLTAIRRNRYMRVCAIVSPN